MISSISERFKLNRLQEMLKVNRNEAVEERLDSEGDVVELSLMTFNVLVHNSKESYAVPWWKRVGVIEDVIHQYEPDVLCLQESMVRSCNDLLPSSAIPMGRNGKLTQYAVTGPFDRNGNLCCRGYSGNVGIHIFYNTEKLELIQPNCRFRTKNDSYFKRPIVYGRFTFKAHPKKEILIFNCHLND